MQKNDIKLANGSKMSYHNYINLRYFIEKDNTLGEIQTGIQEITELMDEEE